jgi:TPR repeat protein
VTRAAPPRLWRATRRSALTGALLLGLVGAARADVVPGELRFEPRGLDVVALCKPWVYLPPSRDWKAWKEGPPGASTLVMIEDADRLQTINPEQPVDIPSAKKLLEYVIAQDGPEAAKARRMLGEILIDDKLDPDQVMRGVGLLERSLDQGQVRAALPLAGLYERGGAVEADLNRAEGLLKRALQGGSGRAAISLARLYKQGAVAAPTPDAAERYWKLGMTMLMSDVAAGRCNELYSIGTAYLDDFAVYRDVPLGMDWQQKSVDARVYQAMVSAAQMARRLITGDEVPLDIDRAVALIDFSSLRGNLQSTHELAELYLNGDPVPRDVARAAEVYDRGVKILDGYSMLQRGRIARGDFEGTPDYALAVDLFRRATELPQPLPESFIELSRMYSEGLGVPQDAGRAAGLLARAVDLGDGLAMLTLADAYLAGDGVPADPRVAVRLLRQAAYSGPEEARERLADIFRCGLGVVPDARVADLWRERAAVGGSERFLMDFADRAATLATPEGDEARFRYLKRAAARGSRRAMVLLGFAYAQGRGTEADAARGQLWLDRAVEPGDDVAKGYTALARAYLDGLAGPSDPDKALALLEEGAKTGEPKSLLELGEFLVSNRLGPPRDPERGLRLIRDAAAAGLAEAAESYRDILDKGVAGGDLTAAELIAEAMQKGDAVEAVTGAREQRSEEELLADLARREVAAACEGDELIEVADAYAKLADEVPMAREKASVLYARALLASPEEPEVVTSVALAIREGILPAERPDQAATLLRIAAEAGYIPAMKALAEVLVAGAGVPADVRAAIGWYERAADAGDGQAAADLFRLVVIDPTVTDAERASAWSRLMKAAEGGSPIAMREVGVRLQLGSGTEADPTQGAAWLKRAAEAGDGQAMREIARSYAAGFGVPLSPADSLMWLERAAALGEPRAMYELALNYQSGFGGKTDPARAEELLEAAQRAGYHP